MNRLVVILFLLLWSCNFASAKNQTDYEKLDSLVFLIKENWWNDPDEALRFVDTGERIAKERVVERLPEFVKYRGIIYYFKGEYDVARKFYNQSLELYQQFGDSSGIAAVTNNLAVIEVELGYYDSAVSLYLSSMEIAEKNKDTQLICRLHTNLGNIYSELGQNDLALEHYLEAVPLVDSVANLSLYATLMNNIGGVYAENGDYKMAFDYHTISLRLRQELGDSVIIATSMSNLGNAYANLKEPLKAIELYKQALSIYESKDYDKGIVSTCNYLGNAYIIIGDYRTASRYFERNIAVAEEMKSGYWESEGYGNLASALFYAGQYEKAYNALLRYQELQDSLQVEQSKDNIAELEKKYETKKKEAEIQRLSTERLTQEKKLVTRTAWLLAAVVLALVFVVVLIVYRNIQQRKNAKLDRKNLEMENQLLRVQMNPHFLFNSLNSIQYYMNNNPGSASIYLAKFSRLTRLILEHSRVHWVNLSEEIEAMKLYLEIEQLRLENKFSWTFEIDDDLDEEMLEVPPMMFQPFIENAIKHGILPKTGKGKIDVVMQFSDVKKILVTIVDDGMGIDNQEASSEHHSLGTQLTNERLQLFEKQYGAKLNFYINSEKDLGTKVNIEIPVREI